MKTPKTTSNWAPDKHRRFNKPFVPDIADVQPPRKGLYVGTLVTRLLAEAERRRKYDRTRFQPEHRFSFANLARVTGMSYRRIKHYFVERDVPLDIKTLDVVLWAMKLSVLDLIEPSEIISYLQTVDETTLIGLRSQVKRLLDKLQAGAHNSISATDSQKRPSPSAEDYNL